MHGSRIKNMEEFAAKCGVSRPTVSKYFHDPNSVKPSTRARIEEALEQFDFRPNIYAINQNRRLTKNIGIVVPYLADPFFAEIARRIEHHCIDAGFSPTLFSSHGRQELENDILDSLRSMKPAGVLLAPLGRASDRSRIEKFCAEVPTVLFDSNIEGIGHAFIGSDNPQFTSQIVEYLCRTGEPPCYFEMKTPPNPNTRKRRDGYISAMTAAGVEPCIVSVEGEGWKLEDIGFRGSQQVIEERLLKTDTVLCTNDRLAIGFLAGCFKKGLQVGIAQGSDIRVAGLDDHPFSRFTCPPLTTVAHDYEAISEKSARTLLALIEGGDGSERRIEKLFEGNLVMRASA
ncbi:MAG: LacI family DNA-binding transcriptional regulator [Rhizobiaceae bacterium]